MLTYLLGQDGSLGHRVSHTKFGQILEVTGRCVWLESRPDRNRRPIRVCCL